MADEIDITNDQQEFLLAKRIDDIRAASSVPQLPKTGCCHYCREPVQDSQVFCDAECAGDYQQLKKFRG